MPRNDNVKVVPLPMVQKWGKEPTTEFVNNLDAIRISLLDAPTMEQLRNYMPMFLDATWAETPFDANKMSTQERDELIIECLKGNALPTALETVGFVWLIDGISLQEVTHILRYRGGSFSADCSADKWWTDKRALVPNSIQNSNGEVWAGTEERDPYTGCYNDEYYLRYQRLVEGCKQLYVDMIDTKKISILDARSILPRCLETFYFVRLNLSDTLHFIKQRIDKQIQPETDNIIAYYMYLELLRRYPIMNDLIDIHAPAGFYVKMHASGRTSNIYLPDKDSDVFDWNPESFIYQQHRNEMNGTDDDATNKFEQLAAKIESDIVEQIDINKGLLDIDYGNIIKIDKK